MANTPEERLCFATQPRDQIQSHQLQEFNQLLKFVHSNNSFYQQKLASFSHPLNSLEELQQLPFTSKQELASSADHYLVNRSFGLEKYTRFHQTSGTRGKPLLIVDTEQDWAWWLASWQSVLDSAEVQTGERALFAFSFGPFIGFWTAFEALLSRGVMAIPAGGMSSVARLDLIARTKPKLLLCTPSYALHLANIAHQNKISLHKLNLKTIIVAGEPGGSIPAVREKIETAWGARVVDHAGASEVGAWGFMDKQQTGLYVNERYFIPEFISLETGAPAQTGELSQLVLTTLGRYGSPLIRYQTGDLVRPTWDFLPTENDSAEQTNFSNSKKDQPIQFVHLTGGVLGRVDDMMIIRGVNVFPSSLEQIIRSFPEVVEYRVTVSKRDAMDFLMLEVEDLLDAPKRIATELQLRLGIKVEVQTVAAGSLPRFEAKGKRFIDQRHLSP